MKKISQTALGAILIFASFTVFACDYPERPYIPDGATASKEELLAAKDGVQTFLASVDEYLQCIELEEQTALESMDEPTPEEKAERNKSINRAFDAANEEKAMVGEQFNEQVRAYNAKRTQSN